MPCRYLLKIKSDVAAVEALSSFSKCMAIWPAHALPSLSRTRWAVFHTNKSHFHSREGKAGFWSVELRKNVWVKKRKKLDRYCNSKTELIFLRSRLKFSCGVRLYTQADDWESTLTSWNSEDLLIAPWGAQTKWCVGSSPGFLCGWTVWFAVPGSKQTEADYQSCQQSKLD